MDRIIDIANYLFNSYRKISGEAIDEMKLHKLLYFVQRESLAVFGKPMYAESLEGWKYGPVSPEVRSAYTKDGIIAKELHPISHKAKLISDRILSRYGDIESWKLSQLSHEEISWKNAREGLSADDYGNTPLNIEDIQLDANKEPKIKVPEDLLKATSQKLMDLHQEAYQDLAK